MTNDDFAPLFSVCLPDLRKKYRVGDALEITMRAVHPLADEPPDGDDYELLASASRNSTYCKHERALEVAAMSGEVRLLNPLDGMPHTLPMGALLLNAWITREELQRFARMKLLIELTMPAVAATALAPAAEELVPAVVALAPASASTANELPVDRDDRRYRELKTAGGDYIEEGGTWHATGPRGELAKLWKREKTAGRPMSDERDVRESLKNAAKRSKCTEATGRKGNSVFNP